MVATFFYGNRPYYNLININLYDLLVDCFRTGYVLVLVLVLIKDHVNHQKDAHPLGIRIPRASILCQWLESDIERRSLGTSFQQTSSSVKA